MGPPPGVLTKRNGSKRPGGIQRSPVENKGKREGKAEGKTKGRQSGKWVLGEFFSLALPLALPSLFPLFSLSSQFEKSTGL
jgi:hypothetical protein